MPTQDEIDAQKKLDDDKVAEALKAAGSTASPATSGEHMIPKSRLDEVLAKAEKAEKEILRLKTAEDERKKKELSEVDLLKVQKKEAEDIAAQAKLDLQAEREKNTAIAEASKLQFGADKEKKLRFINPEVAYKLLTEEAKAKGIVEALTALAKDNPYLLEVPTVTTTTRSGSPIKGKQLDPEDLQQVALDSKRSQYGGSL